MPIREATADDVPTIAALIRELAAFEQACEHVLFDEADLARWLFGPAPAARVTIAAADDGEVAGMALWFPTFSSWLGRPGIWLEDLFVRPPFRRAGHARALLEHLRSQTDGRVEWSVLDWNVAAIAFYEGLGARPVTGWTRYRWSPV